MMKPSDEFYIGYLPQSPVRTAGFTRRVVGGVIAAALLTGTVVAAMLPFYGAGIFEFGHPRIYRGTVSCAGVPRLLADEIDYLLVGPGKHGAPVEICQAQGIPVSIMAARIARGPHDVLEAVPGSLKPNTAPSLVKPDEVLGEFILSGEIVDPKCYFGVMNPGEGRLHRACAILCLRGGITPVLVVRDRAGAEIYVALRVPAAEMNGLLRTIAEPVEVSGIVRRSGQWLVMDTSATRVRTLAVER